MLKHNKNLGFTLIELMIVVAIIGILASIAIPFFNSYRLRSYDAVATSDLKNLRSAEELLFTSSGVYGRSEYRSNVFKTHGKGFSISKGYLSGLTTGDIVPVASSNNVNIAAVAVANSYNEYTVISKHNESDKIFVMESDFPGVYFTDKAIVAKVGQVLTTTQAIKVKATTGQDTVLYTKYQ